MEKTVRGKQVLKMLKFGQLTFNKGELSLENLLQGGQAFRWIYNENKNHYITTMKVGDSDKYVVVILTQPSQTVLEFATVGNMCCLKSLGDHLADYLRLEVSVRDLHATHWIKRDSNFTSYSPQGVRMLAQEPWETMISFICSSNNNISRITKMCHTLSRKYGEKIGKFDSMDYHSFPTSNDIKEKATETELRELGFGYRAKYIIQTAEKLAIDKAQGGFLGDTEYLLYLNAHMTYEQMREHLMSYSGVGPKVADCICLMGLRMDDVVPIDVHIKRIAMRDYKFQAKKSDIKQLAEKYRDLPITRKKINLELDLIRLMFLGKWGSFAGWAQGMLFSKEVGKTSGATTSGEIKKRKLGDITETSDVFEVKKEFKTEECIVESTMIEEGTQISIKVESR